MRKVDLSNLPKGKKMANGEEVEYIRWKDSVGCECSFIFDDITGILKIVSIEGETLGILYDSHLFYRTTDCLKVSKIETIVKNNISITHPDLMCLFKNKEDCYNYSRRSTKKVELICPNCGRERFMTPDKLTSRGFNCPNCTDGISIGEKTVRAVLKSIDVNYEHEVAFDWSNRYRYDYYIPSINCIIETHGEQHYKPNCFETKGGKTLKEQQEIDGEKYYLAINNGIEKYIIINCSYGDMSNILKKVKQSELNNLLDLDNMNMETFNKWMYSSIVEEMCKYWNTLDYKRFSYVSRHFNICLPTTKRLLKQGEALGLCVAIQSKRIKEWIPIYNVDNGDIYNKRQEFVDFLKVNNIHDGIHIGCILDVIDCNKKYKTHTFKFL